jgi:hypothetical protein
MFSLYGLRDANGRRPEHPIHCSFFFHNIIRTHEISPLQPTFHLSSPSSLCLTNAQPFVMVNSSNQSSTHQLYSSSFLYLLSHRLVSHRLAGSFATETTSHFGKHFQPRRIHRAYLFLQEKEEASISQYREGVWSLLRHPKMI